jgi:hypothetical protein
MGIGKKVKSPWHVFAGLAIPGMRLYFFSKAIPGCSILLHGVPQDF